MNNKRCPKYIKVKIKDGVLRPVQQPGSHWDRPCTCGSLTHTDVTACKQMPNH